MFNIKVREIMSCDPLTLRPDQTVGEVVTIFMENRIDGAPVLDDDDKLVGLFTKSHIYRAINCKMDLNTRVEDLMTREILTGHPDDEFGEVVNPTVPRLPVVDENGKMVGMITRGDIAKAFFNSYRTISHEYDTTINSTHNMIISVDENGMIKVCNLSMAKFLGVNGMDMIGRNILDVLPNSDLLNVIKTGKVELLKQVDINGHFLISNRSPIIKDGKIIGAVAVLQDISDLDKMSQELNYVKELNKELDAIVESSYDGLFITDGNGITLRYNKAFE